MSGVLAIARYAIEEAVRRRIFAVVCVLTAGFLVLYWLGVRYLFSQLEGIDAPAGIDARTAVAATVFGLALFATFFLGTVLAVFLTMGAVRGDAERGLLQPLVVRPVGREAVLLGRFLAAAGVCAVYVAVVYAATAVITGSTGAWWPDRLVMPAVELAAAVVLVAALSLLGSVFFSSTANGIGVFMLFGAALVGGLLGQIGRGLGSEDLERVARAISWALPFEGLYQDALNSLTVDTFGATRFLVSLGPFGGAQAGGASLRAWALVYLLGVGALALAGFLRRDL